MPNILNQLGPDAMASLRQIAEQYNRTQPGGAGAGGNPAGIAEADEEDGEDDVPELVEVNDDDKADVSCLLTISLSTFGIGPLSEGYPDRTRATVSAKRSLTW